MRAVRTQRRPLAKGRSARSGGAMRLVHLTLVEMRRALHRRLVWWMVLVACAGCVFTGVVAFLSSDDPVELAQSSGDHPAFMVNWWTRYG